ncbi:MAG: hypothetical protein IPF63_10620 [Bacteroidetes bacterium]|jgi:hypothetical protein|nr:hypothetical protein [Bacteroidota bacterium]MBL0078739.1 hypothetical protein [Bacteroidota bacterium]MBL0287255.1 hypothetical protein [Bacteroidota bacterium]
METVLEILKFTIPSIIILLGAYFMIGSFFEEEGKKRSYDLRRMLSIENGKISLPLRLQAYERILVFLERIHPNSLITRVRTADMSSSDLQLMLVKTIREEYEYNISQQLYISKESWMMVNMAKEEMIKLINLIGSKMHPESNNLELTKAIFEYFISTNQEFPTQLAINFLKEDAKSLF